MSTVYFPLFCWKIDPQNIYATALGHDWQMVDTTVARLKKSFADWVRQASSDDYYVLEPEISDAKLKLVTVPLHLAYRESKGLFPAPQKLELEVAAVYGQNPEAQYWKCFLPLLDTEFYYYEPSQLPTLLEHFARDILEGASPEQTHRYLMRQRPWLEQVAVTSKNKPARFKRSTLNLQQIPSLSSIAEPLPYPRSTRKKMGLIPEGAWERSDIIEPLCQSLLENRSNVLLVGAEGVGKTAIWLEVIKRLHQKTRKQDNPLTFWRTASQRLTANAKYLGEWQQICENLVEDLQQVNGVLWLLDVINLLQTGGEAVEDSVAAFLQPMLQNQQLTLWSEVRPPQLEAMRRLLPGFSEHFQLIVVEEFNKPQVQKIHDYFRRYAQQNLNLTLTPEALTQTWHLLDRYVQYEHFPGKSIRFLSEAVRRAKHQQRQVIDAPQIMQQFIAKTGLPEIILNDHQLLPRQALKDFFEPRIIGQPSAIEQLCSVITTYKAGLNDPSKPIATLLFSGPTGVGKTAAAKALADYFFSLGQAQTPLFRIDMSEFQHPYQLQRLIGYNDHHPGKLIEHVRNRPFSVILLDEIEKADSHFFDVLLALLDEGRLVDTFGRVTDFRQTIIIMTSNLGSTAQAALGFTSNPTANFEAAIKQFFRPEFYNRLDQIIAFNGLTAEMIRHIAAKELLALNQREGIKKRQLSLTFDPSLLDFISQIGFSPQYGARPLQRAIEQHLVAALSHYLLAHPQLSQCALRVSAEQQTVQVRVEELARKRLQELATTAIIHDVTSPIDSQWDVQS